MITVLIADDHPVVRAGLRALCDTESDLEVLGEAATAEEAVALSESLHPRVVLMDLQFGSGMSGATATRLIRAAPMPPHVLVLTNYDTDSDILGAVEAGASGYLLKDAPPAELIAALRAAASGASALAPAIATRLIKRVRSPEAQLSARELEVLRLVANGQSNRAISKTLFLSEATVKSHLVHSFIKLDATSRTQAVARARELGLLRD